jgi:hypothetical protein
MSQAKLGKRRDEETKKRISNTMKGKSNFEGKRHSWESKEKIGEKLMGNHNVRDTYWIHNPRTDKERRVKERHNLARDYQLGRDYYSTEAGLYCFREIKKPTNSPKEIQTNHLDQDD